MAYGRLVMGAVALGMTMMLGAGCPGESPLLSGRIALVAGGGGRGERHPGRGREPEDLDIVLGETVGLTPEIGHAPLVGPSQPAETPDLRGYAELALRGGFPDPVLRLPETERTVWLDSYIEQLLTRDAMEIAGQRDPHKSVSAVIGPEGGGLTLGRFYLRVYPGTLDDAVEITLCRTPGDPDDSTRYTYRDIYTVEPFLLASRPGRPFVGRWTGQVAGVDRGDTPVSLCAKVSWTQDASRSECYQHADPRHFTYEYEDRNVYMTTGKAGWCGFPDLLDPRGPSVHKDFFTDRLGHFRLLPPEEGGMPDRAGAAGYAHPRGSEPPPGCVEIPDVGLRGIIYRSDGQSTVVVWAPYCLENDDCGADSYCRRPEGRCDAMGVCKRPLCHLYTTSIAWKQEPVCGCDGVTYANDCEREQHGVSRRSKGPCPGSD